MTTIDETEHPPCEHPPGEHVLIAARQSQTIKGRDQVAIERQDDVGGKYAAELGCYDPIIAADRGVSAGVSPWKRPDLGQYLVDKPPKPWKHLFGSEIDRLGGDTNHLYDLRRWCQDHGKRMRLDSPHLEWPVPDDDISSRMVWPVIEAFAEIRLKQIKKKYADTRSFLREKHSLTGRICWGFMITGRKAEKTLAPDPSKFRYLLGMIEMAETGKTHVQIAEWLDEQAARDENALPKYGKADPDRQRKTSEKWAPRSIADILRNESLYGVYRENGKKLLTHTGLISKERWDKLQRKLDAKPKRRGPTRNDPMMLTDCIHCSQCGQIMHARHTRGQWRKDGTRAEWLYYRCDGTPREPSTCRNTIPAAEIEEWVEKALTTISADGNRGLFTYADQELKQLIWTPAKGYADEIQKIDDEIDALNRDHPDYRAEHARLMDERDDLIARGTEPAQAKEYSTGILLRDYWPTLNTAGKRDYLIKADVKLYAYRDDKERRWIEGDPSRVMGTLTLTSEVVWNDVIISINS